MAGWRGRTVASMGGNVLLLLLILVQRRQEEGADEPTTLLRKQHAHELLQDGSSSRTVPLTQIEAILRNAARKAGEFDRRTAGQGKDDDAVGYLKAAAHHPAKQHHTNNHKKLVVLHARQAAEAEHKARQNAFKEMKRQALSGVHAEIQFNWQGVAFGQPTPRLANETDSEEAEEPEPAREENAPPNVMRFTGSDCTPAVVIGKGGVAPWEDTFPKGPLNQITVEAWVKDCELQDFGGYLGVIDVTNKPNEPGSNGVWWDLAGGEDPDSLDAGFVLGSYKKKFSWGVASEGTGRISYLQAPTWLSRPNQCEWVHLAGTYDGATMLLYVDGLLTHCQVVQSGPVAMPANPVMLVGGYSTAPPLKGANPSTLTGLLDEVRVWTIARTGADIASFMHDTLITPMDQLAIYFRFDGQSEHKSPKICSEVNGVKAYKGCDSDVAEIASPVSQTGPPMGCGPAAPPGDRTLLNPDYFHTTFNPSMGSFLRENLEDCGPDHNSCDGGAYTDPDYNRAGFY
ncbi:hypothetical protein GUITHDRAFT_144895 [Guillardia theta CCMP2712]|uniref:LamG-like jellyroll fold domain-containing protein n=1 Tax=Guillardia theta (strain CCMP2712) TaxID=905079 RepID=L1IP81_GUITC|nr:hypothetical protein GUITHDRAFT_144895 [Guillardia theta CCMP2712]EKX37625.1 hypothetical protein GUITHDRAFT_144895 [Guillardia theta CCMP2712]|eukprot:XP_005824605.1 hypothetical protein GUITHDRAFT_144895 [Guillardia theta CCMP2712]